MALTIQEVVFNSFEYHQTTRLRHTVLRAPLGMNLFDEDLRDEERQFHIGAFENGQLAGCLVLVPQSAGKVKMRQVAVDVKMQGRGVGKAMVKFAEELMIQHGFNQMELHARETAVPFYLSMGYQVEGGMFTEVGIPHLKMFKYLVGESSC